MASDDDVVHTGDDEVVLTDGLGSDDDFWLAVDDSIGEVGQVKLPNSSAAAPAPARPRQFIGLKGRIVHVYGPFTG